MSAPVFPVLTLAEATAAMDAAYARKGLAARALRRRRRDGSADIRAARSAFNAASRALAQAEAAHRAAEERHARRIAKELSGHFVAMYGGGPARLAELIEQGNEAHADALAEALRS